MLHLLLPDNIQYKQWSCIEIPQNTVYIALTQMCKIVWSHIKYEQILFDLVVPEEASQSLNKSTSE